jgi:ectoine hydroxylase-related dioxygenase (phytanoyl-CoA dioxygenase family)
MKVEEYAAILSNLKPAFIHHPKSKEFIKAILLERGCDPKLTYFDVPRMRTSTSDNYLTSGIAYAFHPHRDTWYSAPMCQINWWLPIYEVESDNIMAFHPHYFSKAVKNSSRNFNYQKWNETSRKEAAKHIKKDTREQPKPEEEILLDPQIRVVTPPGGMVVFSAAQMHSSIPNFTGKTRFSIDFRTVHLGDLVEEKGAVNIDSQCSGTTVGDYLKIEDLKHIPDEVFKRFLN